MIRWKMVLGCLVVPFLLAATSNAQVEVDKAFPSYKFDATGVSGQIKTVGSDTMNNLLIAWTEAFKNGYKSVRAEVEGSGSSKAMPAMIEGAAMFGPMSREFKASEINDFEKKFGYKPILIPTSIDMLGVFVHRDNPMESITLQELDAIFSTTRKLGSKQAIDNWGQLGLKNDFAKSPITLFSRNAASGTYGFFKEKALGNGDFRNTVNEQPGSPAVVQSVGGNKFAIGYSGIGYKTEGVKALAIAADKDSKPVAPVAENMLSGEYPLVRFLYLAVNAKPNTQLDPLRREFLKFVFSKEGQAIVVKDGYFPVDVETAKEALKSVGIEAGF